MNNCKITRKKLVSFSILNMTTGAKKEIKKEWREEQCGTPLFSNDNDTVCKSCLSGWTHENNFMLGTDENQKLLENALKINLL